MLPATRSWLAGRVSAAIHAMISKEGVVEEANLVSGHPLLAPAAVDAVKQWRYKPYYFSGEPVEVETTVNVNFILQDSGTPAH